MTQGSEKEMHSKEFNIINFSSKNHFKRLIQPVNSIVKFSVDA